MTDPIARTRFNLFEAIRHFAPDERFTVPMVAQVDVLCELFGIPPDNQGQGDPRWISIGRQKLGQKEIPGPQHNTWISKGWAALNVGWFNTDETPWCGFYAAWCMDQCGLLYPAKGEFARALAWASFGKACSPQVGAIGVKKRKGGNHVFFIIGQTKDRRFYKCLGGNQSNGVSIMDIAKTDVFSIRWPPGVAESMIELPLIDAGTISRNEA